MTFSENVKVTQAITPTAGAAGTTDINGATLDMSGFRGVMAVVNMGAIVSTAVTSIKMQQGDASDLSDASDLAGTAVTIADTDDDKVFYLDVKASKRYVRVVVDRGTANATVACANYFQYDPVVSAVTHATEVSGEQHLYPAEGTA